MAKTRKAKSLRKAEFLAYWQKLTRRRPLKPRPVPYKHSGSTYAEDGIRITGTRKWIDSVLSRLTDLLAYEGAETRLQVVYKQSTDRETGHPIDSWNCYIQVHQRGDEARMVNLFVSGIAGKEIAATRGY
jgi:hypothetical protein